MSTFTMKLIVASLAICVSPLIRAEIALDLPED